jgi:hypothetical protein
MSEAIRNRKRGQVKIRRPGVFDVVKELGCSLPNVEATTRYDGAPVLKAHGVFIAGLAMHASAEPDTLVVRAEFEEREGLLEDAPDTYYITDYYQRYPVVLVRLSLLDCDVLRELLTRSWRMAVEKRRKGRAMLTKRPYPMQSGATDPRWLLAFTHPSSSVVANPLIWLLCLLTRHSEGSGAGRGADSTWERPSASSIRHRRCEIGQLVPTIDEKANACAGRAHWFIDYVATIYGDRVQAVHLGDLLKTRRPKLKDTVDLLIVKATEIDEVGE